MSTTAPPVYQSFEQIPLREYAERAYLDYSMYVVLDRALPFIGDGLKPVQRRIVYAMSELGLSSTSKHKKSARTVGDVIGKFHPHGDSACYEAMVLMAQPFSYRYPLIDGQGNFGSPDDPKSFAAMRYTESRLTAYAKTLLDELGQGTVDWAPNFDGSLQEPEWLPARLPNVLLNGAMGIAVGMATDIPPHNLREVTSACIRLLDDPEASVEELFEHVPGPDFPTAAEIITPRHDLLRIYETGHGSLRARGIWHREGLDVIVTALPHQVSPAKILEQIAQQMRSKKLPMLEDLRDECDHENPCRLVLTPRSNRVDCEAMMNHLFATTDLEKSFRCNLNMIGLDGRPGLRDLRSLLTEWLRFRTDTVRKRLSFRLDRILRRLHILEGLLIAYLNLDEVIRIIRFEEQPKAALIERFALSDEQAEAILETKLRHLAKLEEMKIRGEQDKLATERDHIQSILDSASKLKALIKDELRADAETHGDARRSPLVERGAAQALSETDLVPSEPVTIVLSQKGWIRAAKGHDIDPTALNYREGDSLKHTCRGRSNQQVAMLDSTGRSYSTVAHSLPSARSQGEPATGRFSPPTGAQMQCLAAGDSDSRWLLCCDFGYGFVTRFENLCGRNKAGKQLLSLPAGAKVLLPRPVNDSATDLLAAVTDQGYLLVFPLAELPELDKGKGNKLINVPAARLKSGEERVIDVMVFPSGSELVVWSGQRYLRLKGSDLEVYRGQRAQRGARLPRGFQRVDRLDRPET